MKYEDRECLTGFFQLYSTEADHPDRSIAVQGTLTLGRDNDIVLYDLTASRSYALLLCDVAGVLLLDLESTNGTFASGAQVLPDEPLRLADGALIRLGRVAARYTTHSLNEGLCAKPNQALLMQSEHLADSPQRSPSHRYNQHHTRLPNEEVP